VAFYSIFENGLAKSVGNCSECGGVDARVALRCRCWQQKLQQWRWTQLFFVFFAQFGFQQQPKFEQQLKPQSKRKQFAEFIEFKREQEFQFGERKEL
jgi:hypothetical protein